MARRNEYLTTMDLSYLSITDAAELLHRRELSSLELTRHALERIARVDPQVGAFLLSTPEVALRQAAAADVALAHGLGGPLTGIPMALEDILSSDRVRTTCGSAILAAYESK